MSTKESQSVCCICVEKLNKSNHALVTCPYCNYEACRSCCETYMLGQTFPRCMAGSCGKEWTRKFIVQNFPKTFVNGALKKNQEKILLDKELALLPATQHIVENIIYKENKLKEANEIGKIITQMQRARQGLIYQAHTLSPGLGKEKHFVRSCPIEECRGFLSTHWKCGLCDVWTCPDCHVIKGKNKDVPHECAPDDLATAKLLDKDTKPCPTCHIGIFKIEGCDQMWCTQCHTAFSWKTGKIENKIHNPHFFEWQRMTGGAPRVQGDILCGREINHQLEFNMVDYMLGNRVVKPFGVYDKKLLPSVMTRDELEIIATIRIIVPCLMHIQQVDLPTYQFDQTTNNINLRVAYMRGLIPKHVFQTRITRDNKKYEKNAKYAMFSKCSYSPPPIFYIASMISSPKIK